MPTIETIDWNQVRTFSDGRLQFFVGICEKVGLPQIINQHMQKATGRPFDIPPAVAAMMLMAPMAQEGYHPLYQLNEYYRIKDLEGIFHYPVQLGQIEDERFGYFLDDFYKSGCRAIFSTVCINALQTYGIQVKSINYDTTSFVMWGEYETRDGKMGGISIDFGHSKAKRPDKKQIKMGLGVANGTIVDAQVLSGNLSDKTYNKENIDDVNTLLERLQVDKTTFYYIADSALFSEEVLAKTQAAKMKIITRMPDNVNEAKELIARGIGEGGQPVVFLNAHKKEVKFIVEESIGDYKGHALKYAVVYSKPLETIKVKSTEKKVKVERNTIDGVIKKSQKDKFACLDDAKREIVQLQAKQFAKIAFHEITIEPRSVEKKLPGRPFLDPSKSQTRTEYQLCITHKRNEVAIQEEIRMESTFVLVSNDLALPAEVMLLEYKTQSGVEKRFQQMKNPQFVNSLYLNTPQRVEALAYLILLTMMVLSVMEQVVREGLKKESTSVICTGNKVNFQPTQLMITRIFTEVITQTYPVNGKTIRRLFTPLNESQAKIIRYLGIAEANFAWNSS